MNKFIICFILICIIVVESASARCGFPCNSNSYCTFDSNTPTPKIHELGQSMVQIIEPVKLINGKFEYAGCYSSCNNWAHCNDILRNIQSTCPHNTDGEIKAYVFTPTSGACLKLTNEDRFGINIFNQRAFDITSSKQVSEYKLWGTNLKQERNSPIETCTSWESCYYTYCHLVTNHRAYNVVIHL